MKNILFFLCTLLIGGAASGQSYHFSQFFSTPLLTNPANTGLIDGPYRVATNLRRQGLASGSNLFTGYISGDLSLLQDKLPAGHRAGAGLYLMNDRSLTGALQTSSAGLSAAYHVGLDDYGERSIGLGFQATYHQRRIDYSKLTFESQYGPAGFDPSLPVGEPLDVNSRSFFDLNAGGVFRTVVNGRSFFAGFSVYNILQHKENLFSAEYKIPTRYTLQAGGQTSVSDYGHLYFSLTSLFQAQANQLTLGGAYGYPLSAETQSELLLGLWYRHKDAVIPYIGFQLNGFQAGFSYDATVSGLNPGTQVRNGYELTLLFKSTNKGELKTVVPWY